MQTVVGVFEDRLAAARAMDILIDSGFDSDHVQLKGRAPVTEPAAQPPEHEHEEGFLGTMSSFFSHLFGEDDRAAPKTKIYGEAVRRGNYVLTVDTSDEDEAEEVEHVLDEAGAIDIDERATQWRAEGWQDKDDAGEKKEVNDWPRDVHVPRGDL